jgi:hypothetical protein
MLDSVAVVELSEDFERCNADGGKREASFARTVED